MNLPFREYCIFLNIVICISSELFDDPKRSEGFIEQRSLISNEVNSLKIKPNIWNSTSIKALLFDHPTQHENEEDVQRNFSTKENKNYEYDFVNYRTKEQSKADNNAAKLNAAKDQENGISRNDVSDRGNSFQTIRKQKDDHQSLQPFAEKAQYDKYQRKLQMLNQIREQNQRHRDPSIYQQQSKMRDFQEPNNYNQGDGGGNYIQPYNIGPNNYNARPLPPNVGQFPQQPLPGFGPAGTSNQGSCNNPFGGGCSQPHQGGCPSCGCGCPGPVPLLPPPQPQFPPLPHPSPPLPLIPPPQLPPPMCMCPPPKLCPPPSMCPPPPLCPPPLPPLPCPKPLPCPPQLPPPPCICPPQPMPFPAPPQPLFPPPQPLFPPPPMSQPRCPMPQYYVPQNDCCCNCQRACRNIRLRRYSLATMRGSKTKSLDEKRERPTNTKCNSAQLQQIISENISDDLELAKRRIQGAAELRMRRAFNTICGAAEFSFIVHAKLYCQASSGNTTCYVFSHL